MRQSFSLPIVLLASACATAARPPAGPPVGPTALWQGESAGYADLHVRFEGVESDSRCRPGVQCIREGEAMVVLAANTDTTGDRLRIQVSSRDSARAAYGQYRVQIDSLSPRPAAGGRYRLWLTLSRP